MSFNAIVLATIAAVANAYDDKLRGAGQAHHVSVMDQDQLIHAADAISDKKYANHGLHEAYQQDLYEPCPADRASSIAFTMTNIEGVHDEQANQLRFGFYSTRSTEQVYFLKDVVHCAQTPYVITGTMLTADEFKAEIETYLLENGLEAVLYNIHGFNVAPQSAFDLAETFKENYEDATKMLFIPVMWRNYWELQLPSYELDRVHHAIRDGKMFAAYADVFNANFTANMMCHSMGNYVFRVMAQELADTGASEVLFDKVFMVSADSRSDMFADAFNPDAPRTEEEYAHELLQKGISLKDDWDSDGSEAIWNCRYNRTDLRVSIDTNETSGIPVEECELNAGLDITKLSNHVHVLWNKWDEALSIREEAHLGASEEYRRALGKYGNLAESYMNLQYFKDRVTFHDLSGLVAMIGLGTHSYELELPAVKIYDPLLVDDCYQTTCGTEDRCDAPYAEVDEASCWFWRGVWQQCCFRGHLPDQEGTTAPHDGTNLLAEA